MGLCKPRCSPWPTPRQGRPPPASARRLLRAAARTQLVHWLKAPRAQDVDLPTTSVGETTNKQTTTKTRYWLTNWHAAPECTPARASRLSPCSSNSSTCNPQGRVGAALARWRWAGQGSEGRRVEARWHWAAHRYMHACVAAAELGRDGGGGGGGLKGMFGGVRCHQPFSHLHQPPPPPPPNTHNSGGYTTAPYRGRLQPRRVPGRLVPARASRPPPLRNAAQPPRGEPRPRQRLAPMHACRTAHELASDHPTPCSSGGQGAGLHKVGGGLLCS